MGNRARELNRKDRPAVVVRTPYDNVLTNILPSPIVKKKKNDSYARFLYAIGPEIAGEFNLYPCVTIGRR